MPNKAGEPFTRAYELKDIEKVDTLAGGVLSDNGGLTKANVSTNYKISDLFNFVNKYDENFNPKPVSEYVLNADGTPKVFYHGTNADFTSFDKSKIGSATDEGIYGHGFYFSSQKGQSEQYGKTKDYYLSTKNTLNINEWSIEDLAEHLNVSESILHYSNFGDKKIIRPSMSFIDTFNSHLKEAGYDSVYVNYGTTDELVVFEPTQIKSAADNIGTYNGSDNDIRYSNDVLDNYLKEHYSPKGTGQTIQQLKEAAVFSSPKPDMGKLSSLVGKRINRTLSANEAANEYVRIKGFDKNAAVYGRALKFIDGAYSLSYYYS